MPSDINPTLAPTKSLVNFRFWCQKVLPLVYDDSLSYYEVLGKMVVQLNDVIDNVNADTDNVLTLKDAFLELQTYVNNFFDDIDQLASYAERAETAQTAANTSAINAATSASNASASSLAAMDARDAAVMAKQAAETSANTASTAATNANTKANEAAQSAITAQTAQASASESATLATTDRTAAQTAASTAASKASEASTSASNAATSANNAKDSKDEAESLVNSVRESLDNIQQNTQDIDALKETFDNNDILKETRNIFDDNLETGTINTSTGANQSSSTQMRSDYIPATAGWHFIKIGDESTNKRYIAYWYDSDKNYINRTSWSTASGFYSSNSNDKNVAFIRIALDTDYGTVNNHDIYISKLTDSHTVIPHETANDIIARENAENANRKVEKYISSGEYDFQIDWMNGNINNTTGALTLGTPNRIFSAQMLTPSIDMAIYSIGTVSFWLFEYTNDGVIQHGFFNQRMRKLEKGKQYRVLAGNFDATSAIEPSAGENIIFVPLNEERNTIKIATFNVGKWYNGTTSGCPSSELAEQINKWRDFIAEKNLNLICTNEYYETFEENGQTTPFDEILHIGFSSIYKTDGKEDALLANVPIYSFRQENLASGTEAWRFNMLLNNTIVNFLFTHLSTEDPANRRATDLASLRDILTANNHTVICMDSNIRSIDEWNVFANFNMANGGLFGTFKTIVDNSSPGYTNRAIDNIITTKDIEISMVESTDVIMSDHYPVIARLLIK